MNSDSLQALLVAAQARRDAGQWEEAARLFHRAEALAPHAAHIKHNLAMAYYARGSAKEARQWAEKAIALDTGLWQSRALLARIHRAAGDAEASAQAWDAVLAYDPANGTALFGKADLAMNEFGDAAAALALATPLANDAHFGVDAQLTALMAALYLGADARALSGALTAFSQANLRLPRKPVRTPRAGRRRVGLVSPLFSASPVYFLTYSAWAAVAQAHDLVFFSRGTRRDWATERLQALATEWIDVAGIEPAPLADRIAAAEIDVLFDLGGWSDAAGLAALSAKPAARMYKWVGGQSATTGIDAFDGWIGDDWQSPYENQHLYAEPIVNIAGGYIDFTPPDILASLRDLPRSGVGLVGNPVKIVEATLATWPSGVDRVVLIDRRYAHAQTLERVREVLARGGIAVERVVVPRGQDAYLRAVAECAAIVNTQPYAAGLTAVEAHALGIEVLGGSAAGALFCARHHLSHRRTGGRNRALAPQLLQLIAR